MHQVVKFPEDFVPVAPHQSCNLVDGKPQRSDHHVEELIPADFPQLSLSCQVTSDAAFDHGPKRFNAVHFLQDCECGGSSTYRAVHWHVQRLKVQQFHPAFDLCVAVTDVVVQDDHDRLRGDDADSLM